VQGERPRWLGGAIDGTSNLLIEADNLDAMRALADEYLAMLFDRLVLMREVLAPHGSIYVHLDWRTVHYVKILLDEIF